jgi:hypothetical protein
VYDHVARFDESRDDAVGRTDPSIENGGVGEASEGRSMRMGRLGSNPEPVRAWTLFFVFGLLIAAHGLYLIMLPTTDPHHWRYYTSDAEVVAYLSDEFRASGGMEVALGALTMLIAVRWFRAGDPWAWLGFWVFPVLFAWGMVTTWAVLLWLVLLLAAAGTLVGTYGRFFRRTKIL